MTLLKPELALQEVRWPGKGQINKKDYLFYYSGTKEKTGQAGTGFLLMKKIQKYIINFELHNECLCKLRIKGKLAIHCNIEISGRINTNQNQTKDCNKRILCH